MDRNAEYAVAQAIFAVEAACVLFETQLGVGIFRKIIGKNLDCDGPVKPSIARAITSPMPTAPRAA
jgi:hypothetical protein